MRPIKQITTCFIFLACLLFGMLSAAEDNNSAGTGLNTVSEAPYIDLSQQPNPDTEKAGACCHAKGDPECGGRCDICCKVGEVANCVESRCNPHDPFNCRCERRTSCSCEK
jgi:hypothetical protein